MIEVTSSQSNSERPLIGVLGGTFDPVHVGHLRLAIELQERLSLDHVRLIPVATPNHRNAPIASQQQRIEMLDKVCDGKSLILDRRECDRGGVSYMVDTLRSLRDDFPDAALCLIVGRDAYRGLPTWYQWRDLFDSAHIIVANRSHSTSAEDKESIAPELRDIEKSHTVTSPTALSAVVSGKILFAATPLMPISSTMIRKRLNGGRSIHYLVDNGVEDIIRRDKLYIKYD